MVLSRVRSRRSGRVGVALAADRLDAVSVREGHAYHRTWSLHGYPGAEYWVAVESVLQELCDDAQSTSPALHFVLLPPLVQLRSVDLPPLDRTYLIERLIAEAPKYFPVRQGPLAVTILRRTSPEEPSIAIGVPEGYIERLEQLSSTIGARCESVCSPLEAWTAVDLPDQPGDRDPSGHTRTRTINHGGLVYTVRHDRKGIRAFTRNVARLSSVILSERCCLPVSFHPMRPDTITMPADNDSPGADGNAENDGVTLAARGAARLRRFSRLCTAADLERRRTRARHRRRLIAAATVVLAVVASLLYGASLEAQLRRLETAREALADEVAVVRASLTAAREIESRIIEINDLDSSRPLPTRAISDFTRSLTSDAWLTLLFIAPDSALLEGYADDAAAIYTSLSKANEWRSRGLQGAVRREPDPTGTPKDHFLVVMEPAHKTQESN